MDYYKRFMGDYQRDTGHLSLAQHGAYTVLLDHYYSLRKPLPTAMEELHRLCRATTKAEQAAVERVVDEFFRVGDDGRRHNWRADEEIAKWEEFAQENREKGKLGGRPKKNPEGNPTGSVRDNPEETRRVSSGFEKGPISKPGENPLQNPNPNPDPEARSLNHSLHAQNARAGEAEAHERWRDVETCDQVAYQTWLDWRASENDTVPDRVRIQDAKFLGGKGSPAQQREFIDKLIRLRFKRLHDPIEHRSNGAQPGAKPSPERESLELRELKDGRAQRGLSDFRDPMPHETPEAYRTALRTEENRRGGKLGEPRFPLPAVGKTR
jgi:uncharacterized protein YdaU (DUF1376 family)